MIKITEDKVIKVRMGVTIVDMFDKDGELTEVEGNAEVVKKLVKKPIKDDK
mgnify:CR=1 FL=1